MARIKRRILFQKHSDVFNVVFTNWFIGFSHKHSTEAHNACKVQRNSENHSCFAKRLRSFVLSKVGFRPILSVNVGVVLYGLEAPDEVPVRLWFHILVVLVDVRVHANVKVLQ